jgi:hypothetical protein
MKNCIKGYIKGNSIVIKDTLPENVKDGDEVQITIFVIPKQKYPFPTFELGVKEEYLSREKIYEPEQDIL